MLYLLAWYGAWGSELTSTHTHAQVEWQWLLWPNCSGCIAVAELLWLNSCDSLVHRGHHAATVPPCTAHGQDAASSLFTRVHPNAEQCPWLQVFRSPPQHYRCRCEFTVWHDEEDISFIMYEKVEGFKEARRRKIEQYPVACTAINEMMPVLLRGVKDVPPLRHKLFQVNFHCSLSGQAMVTLLYHKKIAEVEADWRAAATPLRHAPVPLTPREPVAQRSCVSVGRADKAHAGRSLRSATL